MNKCLKIIIFLKKLDRRLTSIIQKFAKKHNLEGFAQLNENDIKITVCGSKDDVDDFLDKIYKEFENFDVYNKDVEIVPFIKDRDYRGIFRVIE